MSRLSRLPLGDGKKMPRSLIEEETAIVRWNAKTNFFVTADLGLRADESRALSSRAAILVSVRLFGNSLLSIVGRQF